MANLWFVDVARDALKEGYRVIAHHLNLILQDKALGVRIHADPMRHGDSLPHAVEQFESALPGLQTKRQMPPRHEIQLWTLGATYTSWGYEFENFVTPFGLETGDRFDLTRALKSLREERAHWSVDDWREKIKAHVEARFSEWMEWLNGIEAEAAAEAATLRRAADPPLAGTSKPKRSTAKGDAKTKLTSGLLKHHKYPDDALYLEPIGCRELADQVGVSEGSASAFFRKFFEGWEQYRAICHRAAADDAVLMRFRVSLTVVAGDLLPRHVMTGRLPGAHHQG